MAGKTVDEGDRKLRQRPHVEIDHVQLLVAVEHGGGAGEPETGIVDHIARFEIARGKLCSKTIDGVALAEIERQDQRTRPSASGDLVGERGKLALAPRDHGELMPVRGKNPRQLRPDPGGGAGNHGDGFHAPSLFASSPARTSAPATLPALSAMRWRSSMRSRGETPRRSAARHNRLSSSSSRLPSA